jgi:hypothetical protein
MTPTSNQHESVRDIVEQVGLRMLAHELDLMRPRQMGEFKLHPETACKGEFCTIHNPSDHPLKDAPAQLRADRAPLMERRCPHGIGHPDPDSLAFIERVWPGRSEYEGVHGCDGCCHANA